jgi:hypothetical protein
VWHSTKSTNDVLNSVDKSSNIQTPVSKSSDAKNNNILKLANNKVAFTLPTTWAYQTGSDKCKGNLTADLTCIEGAVVTPGTKLPTRYGNGTEFFYISVSVFNNPHKSTAQTWLEQDFQHGTGTGILEKSSAPMNKYDTYYMIEQYTGDDTTIREMHYVFSVSDKAVYVVARTYEPGKLDNGASVGDFKQFEPQITAMAKSVKINY